MMSSSLANPATTAPSGESGSSRASQTLGSDRLVTYRWPLITNRARRFPALAHRFSPLIQMRGSPLLVIGRYRETAVSGASKSSRMVASTRPLPSSP